MIDALGTRMKEQYEIRTKTFLPRRTYTIIRLDGVAFHTYTRGLKRPYDDGLIADMNETAKYLCEKIQGAKFAFVQSDEISIFLTDFEKNETDAWFDGEVQKIVSVSAAIATAKFNQLRLWRKLQESGLEKNEISGTDISMQIETQKLAYFDSRVYTIPDPIEVGNYFVWRQADCTRNSITMAAQSVYSHKELEGKNSNEKQEMLFQKGINWNDYPVRFKRGGFICKIEKEFYKTALTGPVPLESLEFEDGPDVNKIFKRNVWACTDPSEFTKEQEFLYNRIPVIASEIMSLYEVLKKTKAEPVL